MTTIYKNRFFWMTSLLFLGICVFVLGWLAQSRSFQTVDFHGIEYVGVPDVTSGSDRHITGPVSVKKIKHPLELNSLSISFEFMTQEATFSYGNLFQTGDTLDAIRMELQPSSNLVLVLGNGKLFPLSDEIKISKYYKVQLKYEREQFLKVFIDEIEVLNVTDKVLLAGSFDLSNIVVGTGLASQRTLAGVVKNFNFYGSYSYADQLAKQSRWMLIILCGLAFLKSLPIISIVKDMGKRGIVTTPTDLVDSIAVYGFTLVFIAMGLLSIYLFGEQHLGLSKWIVHLIFPVSLVVLLPVINRQRQIWNRGRWPLGAVFIAYVMYIIVSTAYKEYLYDAFILGIITFSLLAFSLILGKARLVVLQPQRGGIVLMSYVVAGFSILYLALTWSSLAELTNWQAFRQAFENNFAINIVGTFLVFRVVFSIIFEPPIPSEIHNQNLHVQGKVKDFISRFYMDIAVISVFFWMSFRHDSLFIPGSEYHWEYYVGVVQGIWNGGWLLWDTPSQYGFLNILLASLVPSASAWQSFYIFQGILLFLVSTGLYFAARRYTSTSVYHRLAFFAILFMALFYADPELIGPYPFPSSSVVRFFGVYVLVLVSWTIPKFGLRQAIVLAIAWSLAVIWSAESAIYATAIFLFILFALLLTRTSLNDRFVMAGKYIVIAIMFLIVVIVTICAFYYARLGVLPDLFGYFEHAVGYAGGFGYVPFSISGPGNLLLLVFMAISILCISVIQRGSHASENFVAPLAAMAGCIWGISTYYIGRPVPQNVTAMLPLITMVVYLTLMLSHRMQQGAYSIPIKAAAMPLFFLLLIPLFNQKWFENLTHIQSFSANVTTKLPKATNELQQLLSRAEASTDMPIVYYGDDAAPPILSGDYASLNETNWLPIPLQLLEQPVSISRRNLYLNRYICRNQPNGGILINRKGSAIEMRLQGFLQELRQFYDTEEVVSGNIYNLYRFSNINLQRCTSEVGRKTL